MAKSKQQRPAAEDATTPDDDDTFSLPVPYDEFWDKLCNIVAAQGQVGEFVSNNILRRLVVNAPVILGFTVACIILHVVTLMPSCGDAAKYLGCPDTFHPARLMAWVRLVTHIFGHSGYGHLKGNMVNLLMVGPSAEHHFGSKNLVYIMLLVAVSSGMAHNVLGQTRTVQLGASGVVFAMILLNSLVSATYGTIPVTFAITALLWISDEVSKLLFSKDGVSHHAHLTGAIVGTVAGYFIHKRRHESRAREIAAEWLSSTRAKKGAKGRDVPWWAGGGSQQQRKQKTKKKAQ